MATNKLFTALFTSSTPRRTSCNLCPSTNLKTTPINSQRRLWWSSQANCSILCASAVYRHCQKLKCKEISFKSSCRCANLWCQAQFQSFSSSKKKSSFNKPSKWDWICIKCRTSLIDTDCAKLTWTLFSTRWTTQASAILCTWWLCSKPRFCSKCIIRIQWWEQWQARFRISSPNKSWWTPNNPSTRQSSNSKLNTLLSSNSNLNSRCPTVTWILLKSES